MDVQADAERVQRLAVSSRDAGEIEEFIARGYVGNRVRVMAVDGEEAFTASRANVSEIAVGRVRSTVEYVSESEPFDHYLFVAVHRGRMKLTHGRDETIVGAGESSFYPLGSPMQSRMFDLDATTLQVPARRLQSAARDLAGADGADVRFSASVPVSGAMARYWASVMSTAVGAGLEEDSVLAHPLLAEDLARIVATSALHTFPNTTWSHRRTPAGRVGPVALRRAVAHIEDNAHLPLTLSELADAAGSTGRALQYAFARHHGTTPMAYLRRVRLDHAHRELQAADPTRGATVAAIARRWGFANPSRFAQHYRAAYGRLPGATLRA